MRLYFGFGANKDIDMIRAVTGRGAFSIPATVDGFALCIEKFENITKKAQQILTRHWDESFQSYGIVRRPKSAVSGRLWLLTNAQREAIKNWEIIGIWSHEVSVQATVRLFGIPVTVRAESEELRGSYVDLVTNDRYRPYIVPKKRILAVAKLVRLGA